MNRTDFHPGEVLMGQGEHEKAFRFFQAIATDLALDARRRADAYTWLGSLVRIDPSLGEGDECGLSFYQRAVELDSDNLGAMLGIAETFGDSIADHQDQASFRRAIAWLLEHEGALDERLRSELERIRRKHADILEVVSPQ